MCERTEETWSYAESQHIHKENQSETLRIVEHGRVHCQPEMSCKDSDEKDEGYSERNTHYAEFAKGKSHSTDHREDDYRLYR